MISNKQAAIIALSTIAAVIWSIRSNPPSMGMGLGSVARSATTVALTYERRFDDIKDMSIADGLKAILIKYGFTSERLIRLSPSDLASILGIDEYVAKIIHNAAIEQLS